MNDGNGTIFKVLDELEEKVNQSVHIPMSRKAVVDAEHLLDLLDRLRSLLPEEVRQARWVNRERERVLQEARVEAQQIVEQAQRQSEKMASQAEVVAQANHQANEIINRAQGVGQEIREGANEYAGRILEQLEVTLKKAVVAVREGQEQLSETRSKSQRTSAAASEDS